MLLRLFRRRSICRCSVLSLAVVGSSNVRNCEVAVGHVVDGVQYS